MEALRSGLHLLFWIKETDVQLHLSDTFEFEMNFLRQAEYPESYFQRAEMHARALLDRTFASNKTQKSFRGFYGSSVCAR